MMVSELKPIEEILGFLEGETKIFLLGCNGCAAASGTGDEASLADLASQLEAHGKEITGKVVVDFLCEAALVKTRLVPRTQEIMESDAVLVATCGVGIQTVAASIEKVVHPACNTIPVGGSAEWASRWRCAECGDCMLDYTGGICPITNCSKSLLNGICGGSEGGDCEVRKDIPCGWAMIYERQRARGRLDRLREFVLAKSHAKEITPAEVKTTVRYNLDIERQPAVEEVAE